MTSFVGKWRLLVFVLFVGYYAFAKADPPATIAHTIYSNTEIATFSIDKSSTRTEIFELFKELFINHSVKAKLNGYKRHGGVITLLDLTLTDQNGAAFPLNLQNDKGIDTICLTLNPALNNIVEFAPCDVALKAVTPVKASQYDQFYKATTVDSTEVEEKETNKKEDKVEVNSRQAAQDVIAARKAKVDTEIEAARLRVKQQQEQRRIDVLARKAKLEAQQEENRIKNEQLIAERTLKREQQLREVSERQLARRQEAEAARIAKLEEEKRQIAIETNRLETLAQEERNQLETLEKKTACCSTTTRTTTIKGRAR